MKSLMTRHERLAFLAVLVLLYSAVSVLYLVAPIAHEFGGVLLGSALLPADALLNSAILEWGFRSLFSSSHSFFDWNAGFPLQNTLAGTENLIGWQVLYFPLRTFGLGVAGAYNTLLLVSLLVSAMGGALLALRLGARGWGAAAAGLIFGYGPFHLSHIMHIQTMAVCWTPYAILYLDRYMMRPNYADAMGLGVSFAITALSSLYFAVFLALILPIYVLLSSVYGRHALNFGIVGRLIGIGLFAGAAVSPLALPYVRFAAEHGRYHESTLKIASLSMDWLAPLRTPLFQIVWSDSRLRWPLLWNGEPAFFGVVALILIMVGVAQFKRGNSVRAVVLTLVTLSIICYLLALGPYFKTAGKGPSRIVEWVPMPGRLWVVTPGIRWPNRIFFFAWLGGAILAGIGLSAIHGKMRSPWRNIVGAAAILLLVLEYWPASWLAGNSVRVSPPMRMSDAYPFLANEADRGGVIELPISHEELLARYIYGASGHMRRVVALRGRRVPLFDSLRTAGDSLPRESARVFLSNHGVTRVVVHRFLGDSATNAGLIASLLTHRYPLLFKGRESVVFGLSGSSGGR